MKILRTGKSADGVDIRIEEWHENYSFMPYGSKLAFYPESKATHKEPLAPKAGEGYRFSFGFPCYEDAEAAFTALENGSATFTDYLEYWDAKPKYKNCI